MARRAREQALDQVKENPLGLETKKITPVVKSLNEDLATMYTLYHQVKKHHWIVEGPEWLQLHEFLEEWADDLEKSTDLVAERITALGGIPVGGAAAQEKMAVIEAEPEGMLDLRVMLEKDMTDGTRMLQAIREHIGEALEVGDFGTEQLLKVELLEHEENVHHMEHFLEMMSLTEEIGKSSSR